MTTLVFVVVMTFTMDVLVRMFARLMGVFLAIMGMGHGLVVMLVLMFVFVVAAHFDSPPW